MTTTAQTWCDRARVLLTAGGQAERNTLAAPYTAGGNTLTFTYPLGGITAGSRLSIGLNTFYVWSVSSSGTQATVSGGDAGSVDANAANGATVWVRPRFTDHELFTSLNEELDTLSSPQQGLFQVKTVDLSFNSAINGYDLGVTDVLDVYEVRAQTVGPDKLWPRIPGALWRLDRSAYTSDFASGVALKLYGGDTTSGFDVRVVYKAPFTQLTDLTTAVSTTGLPSNAYDIPPLGAAIRMTLGREIKRNFTETQPDTRRGSEVPPGAVLNSNRGLLMKYQQRVADASARLLAQYPPVFDG